MTRRGSKSSTFDVTAARFAGFANALAEAGIPIDMVPFFECAHGAEALGAAAGDHLLALADRPTAVLAMSDRLAMGVMAAAHATGIAVPGDVSVTGFDDIAAAAHARPALTTVRQELRLKGYAAARLLLDSPTGAPGMGTPRAGASSEGVDGGRLGDDRTWASSRTSADEELGLPLELVVRRSTAAPPQR